MWRSAGEQPNSLSTTLADSKSCRIMYPNVTKIIHLLLLTSVTLEVVGMHSEKLKSRYEHLYALCYLQVRVKSADMKCAVDLLMNNESWPRGLFVNRFFKPKEDGHAQQ